MTHLGLEDRRIGAAAKRPTHAGLAPARRADALKIRSVFGTRSESIKFFPVLRELDARPGVSPITHPDRAELETLAS